MLRKQYNDCNVPASLDREQDLYVLEHKRFLTGRDNDQNTANGMLYIGARGGKCTVVGVEI
jgi:hypothetical protein